jgi:imidazolonepropionase-like amidohydrolase
MRFWSATSALLFVAAACASSGGSAPASPTPAPTAATPDTSDRPQYPSTYQRRTNPPVLIRNATIMTATGQEIANGSILLRDGRIVAVGAVVDAPGDATVVDGTGKWVTPGIIDNHSHLGVYPAPEVAAVADGNEISDPNTAQVWAEHGVWPQDPGFAAALAGGVTTLQILPGSANLFGGRSVVVKNVPARTVQEMKFPGAPHGLKMACGENPKRVYGFERLVAPGTRMGNVAGYRQAWARARDYMAAQAAFDNGTADKAPEHDLQLETLAGVLRGEILVHNHCYRADEMAVMLDVAREFGYRISSFHHAVEAYKIADLLAESGTCAAMWADWWGFKLEAFDAVRENVAMVDSAGACAIVHSDSATGIQRLNQEAAKAMAAAQRSGIAVDHAAAMRWLSLNPARSLGIDAQTGSLEAGKMADVVIWDGDPFSVYTKAEKVFIDGALVFDRAEPARQPVSDFELGLISLGGDAP